MKLEIVSPDGILFEGETESVSFPGVAGSTAKDKNKRYKADL